MGGAYEAYLRSEWAKLQAEPQRQRAALEATAQQPVKRVLDVGCGAGQELLPFVFNGASGIGADVAPDALPLARRLLGREGSGGNAMFVCSAAEQLPFPSGIFDVVISRLALPYTDNRRAIAEMARVLSARGTLLLKIHHLWYYVARLWRGVADGQFLTIVHAARVLLASALYHLTGCQVRNRLVTGETGQSHWLLRRELGRCGLQIVGAMPDSNLLTPSFVIRKAAAVRGEAGGGSRVPERSP